MKKKEKVVFSLQYKDSVVFDSYEFETNYFDIIDYADSVLEKEVWGRNIDMDTEEFRCWRRLDSTTYRALYNIPKDVMSARFKLCVSKIEKFLEIEEMVNVDKNLIKND